jgi:hypothetical protein
MQKEKKILTDTLCHNDAINNTQTSKDAEDDITLPWFRGPKHHQKEQTI